MQKQQISSKISQASLLLILVLGCGIFSSCQKSNEEEIVSSGNRVSGYVDSLGKSIAAPQKLKENDQGTYNGWFWSLYREGGSGSLTHGSGGNFAISYSNCRDVVGGKGWNPGAARTINYNVGSLTGAFDFVGVYGWTRSPLIEYYVSEFGSIPGSTQVNTITIDGRSYRFIKNQRVNAPSIIGTATFWQYIDNWGGSSRGTNRSINMSAHINNWRSRGGQGFGSYDYQILALEAFNYKSGYINATVW